MKEGKLNFDDLREMIQNSRKIKRSEVVVRNDVGEDCSVIDFGGCEGVFSTDPITGACENIGKLAVNINCNDIASSGGEPIALLVTILAPTGSTLEEINEVMKEISEEAEKINVEIIGGHTEVTSAVNRLIVSITVIGKTLKGASVRTSGAMIGDDIVVTKDIALEGTSILANDQEDRLKKVLNSNELKEAKNLINNISVLKEGGIAGRVGVNSMHDITEGGLLGALFEVGMASDTGFIVYEEMIPILDVTKKISAELSIDPLRLISSGSMLITCKCGEELVKALNEEGIKGSVIGKVTKSKGVLVSNGVKLEVEEPKRDELFNIK
ncbi:AIR synthase family protein [Clostridium paraputrificum]|uniref:AIR synthase family protein n=1 Tax=Clostridium paraputrificum TaxID=29363 RepID=UPI003D33534B